MHRTQIMLGEQQYQALKRLARIRKTSMGQLVREFVERGLQESAPATDGLGALRRWAGFIDEAEGTGRDHDETLYGKDR